MVTESSRMRSSSAWRCSTRRSSTSLLDPILCDAGLAPRDIKPANLMVRDGRILLSTSPSGVGAPWLHPSTWQHMLCSPRRAPAVYDRRSGVSQRRKISERSPRPRIALPSKLRRHCERRTDLHVDSSAATQRPRPSGHETCGVSWPRRRGHLSRASPQTSPGCSCSPTTPPHAVEVDPRRLHVAKVAQHKPAEAQSSGLASFVVMSFRLLTVNNVARRSPSSRPRRPQAIARASPLHVMSRCDRGCRVPSRRPSLRAGQSEADTSSPGTRFFPRCTTVLLSQLAQHRAARF